MRQSLTLGYWLLLGFLVALHGESATAFADDQTPDYTRQVEPILKKYCMGCHNSKDAKSDLALDTYDDLRAGGKRGPSVVTSKSGESLLLLTTLGKVEPKMPPKNRPAPTTAEIEVLRRWIDGGAKGPQTPAAASTPFGKPRYPRLPPRQTMPASVNALAFSPDGKVAAAARYEEVVIFDPATGDIRHPLKGITGKVTAVRFSGDGTKIIGAAGEPGLWGQVVVWNVTTGQRLTQFQGHGDSLYALDLSADNKILASAGYDKDIKLWDFATGKELRALRGHGDAVFALTFSPHGKFIASASGDRTVKIWDVARGNRLDTFSQPLKDLYAVAFSPDGKRVAAAGVDNRIRVWEISPTAMEGSNRLLFSRFAHESPIVALVYSRDGKLLLSSAEDRTVKVWNAHTVQESVALEKQPDWVPALAFHPDGKTFLLGRHDGTIAAYEIASGKKQREVVLRMPPPPKPELVAMIPPGVQRGATSKIRLEGKNLTTVQSFTLNHAGIKARLISPNDAPTNHLWVEITTDAHVPRGNYTLAAVAPGGITAAKSLLVDDVPSRMETEPNNQFSQATHGPMGAVFHGVLSANGDVDYFAVDAHKGQTLVFDLTASAMGSKLNGVLTVFEPSGRSVAVSNDFDGQPDPLLAYTVTADGVYRVRVTDLQFNGSAQHEYRLAVGNFAQVTGVYPLGLPPNSEANVELAGYNLPKELLVALKTPASGQVKVPLDNNLLRSRRELMVVVGNSAEVRETEPNNIPTQATPLTTPGTANGRISTPSDQDHFRFHATKGETWIVETDASRRGSPVDTRLEILDSQGNPVERVILQATRDSYVHFRGINSSTQDVRVKNWEEMELNEFLYLQGEVCKLFRMPQGPDSGFLLYGRNGQRITYFDTNSTTHALQDPCYIVEPHAPGTSLIANGLPVFPVYFQNDDAGDRSLGRDSRVTFTAPRTGDYVARVVDSRGFGGDRFVYRLNVRKPQPDFNVRVVGANPAVPMGSGKEITFVADRVDGFDGPIRVDVSNLPPGFRLDSPVVIEAGHFEARASLVARADALAPTKKNAASSKIIASAQVNGHDVSKSAGSLGTISLGPKPPLRVWLEPAEIILTPGTTVTAMLKVERFSHKERIQFDVNNLPHGVIVDNIGLNGILIRPGENERQVFLNARPWVSEATRTCHAVSREAGNQASPSITVHIRDPKRLANVKP